MPEYEPRFPNPERLLHVAIVFFVIGLLIAAAAFVGGLI